MKIKKILLSAIAVALLSGCSTKEVNPIIPKDLTKDDAKEVYVEPELKNAPSWVFAPKVEGYISAVGSAPRNAGNSFSLQSMEAKADGKDALLRAVKTKVSNMFTSLQSTTTEGTSSNFEKSVDSITKQVASGTLNSTELRSTWFSKSGTMYVLMAVKAKDVVESAKLQAKKVEGIRELKDEQLRKLEEEL